MFGTGSVQIQLGYERLAYHRLPSQLLRARASTCVRPESPPARLGARLPGDDIQFNVAFMLRVVEHRVRRDRYLVVIRPEPRVQVTGEPREI